MVSGYSGPLMIAQEDKMTEFKEFKMNIYLLSQNVHDGYDTFDAMVVAADDVIEAKTLSMEKWRRG